jgi:hypothetical protein
MEIEQFDDLTRHWSGAGSSRRQALRAGLAISGADRLAPVDYRF